MSAAYLPLYLPAPGLDPVSLCPCRLKALGEGSKQWSSSAPNLGKSPKHTPMAPGFASLNEMGKRVWALWGVGWVECVRYYWRSLEEALATKGKVRKEGQLSDGPL